MNVTLYLTQKQFALNVAAIAAKTQVGTQCIRQITKD